MSEAIYTYDVDHPYMTNYEYFATLDEASARAGKMAFKYDSQEELIYKVIGKAVSKKVEPTYDIVLI